MMDKISIGIQRYLIWFLVNFIICLLPIVVSGLIANSFDDNIFLSYLAFSYTLIMTSLYVFESNEDRGGVLLWVSIIVSTLILCLFILFPSLLPEDTQTFFRSQIWEVSSVILLTTILISLFLNKPALDDQIEKSLNKKKFKEAKKTGKRVGNMLNELRDEQ